MTTPQPDYTLNIGVHINHDTDTFNTSLSAEGTTQPQYPEVVAALVNTLINTLIQADPRDYKALSTQVVTDIQDTFTDEKIQAAIKDLEATQE